MSLLHNQLFVNKRGSVQADCARQKLAVEFIEENNESIVQEKLIAFRATSLQLNDAKGVRTKSWTSKGVQKCSRPKKKKRL